VVLSARRREALRINDGERAAFAMKGIAGKRLSIGRLAEPDYKAVAKRFARWRKKTHTQAQN